MTTPNRNLLPIALVAILLIALAALLIVPFCGSDGDGDDDGASARPTRTPELQFGDSPPQTPFVASPPQIAGGPTPPTQFELPASRVMFCVPMRVPDAGALLLAPTGAQPRYRDGTCDPIPGPGDTWSMLHADGTIGPEPLELSDLLSDLSRVVWVPAEGVLNGERTVLTGRFVATTEITDDAFGEVVAIVHLDAEGGELLAQVTRAHIGLPLALFIDGDALRTSDGEVWSPFITEEHAGPITFQGLSSDTDRALPNLLASLRDGE